MKTATKATCRFGRLTGVVVARLSKVRPYEIAAEIDWIVEPLFHGMSPRGRSRS
jgi:hypothetical protein